jgi:EmrB/QacA subfamily drug resistance transporter
LETSNGAQAEIQTGKNSKLVALIGSSMILFGLTFMASSLNVALPVIGREFRADAIVLGWIVSSYLLAVVVFLIPFSRLADLIGIKKIYLWGSILFTISLIIAMFSNSISMLIILRVLQGVGCAMMFGNGLAMITAIYPARERGSAFGISTLAVYGGSSVGPFLGGIMTEHVGWRSVFIVGIVMGVIFIPLLFWRIKGEWCVCKGEKFDYRGSIIYGLAMIALMYGFSELPAVPGMALVAIGILGLGGFIIWENRTRSPIMDVSIFRKNKVFTLSNLAALISYAAVSSIAFLLSLYLQYIKVLTPEQAGTIMLVQPVMMAILSPLTGRLSDKIEPRIVSSAGMSLTCAGLISFVFLTSETSLVHIMIALAVLGVGFALFSSPNINAIMSSVAPKYYGVASATSNTMRSVGQMLSMGITMTVIATLVGRVEITAQYYPAFLASTRIAFGIFAVLCFVGIFASLSRGKVR